jgi:uncharacterized membrane protein (DUF4010 family)
LNSNVLGDGGSWLYSSTLLRLAVAAGLGLLAGLERERRGKEAGSRTFAFAAATGCAGGLLGDSFALAALALLVPLIVFINLNSMKREGSLENTTCAALCVIGFVGILCGKGHFMPAVALGLATVALLAWKQPLSGFSVGITEAELRSAILLGILAFVIYPVLPSHTVDPWGLVNPQVAFATVILVAAIGFCNYVLHKIYGARGFEAAGFFGGLVNSIVAIIGLANLTKENEKLVDVAFKGTMLATAAMLVRNAFLLGVIAPKTLCYAALPMLLMLIVCLAFTVLRKVRPNGPSDTPDVKIAIPFALPQALKFGGIFLVISVMGTISQRALGSAGFYVVNSIGGIFSSGSSVAAAGELSAQGKLTMEAGGIGSVLASISSTLVSILIVARVGKNAQLTRSVLIAIGLVSIAGIAGAIFAPAVGSYLNDLAAGAKTSG